MTYGADPMIMLYHKSTHKKIVLETLINISF